MSFVVPACLRHWPVAVALSLLLVSPSSLAQRVSARDRAASEALEQRMAAAEKRYRDGLVLVANSDPRGATESDAALEDMEDVLAACTRQRGCQMATLLATYKRLLKGNADAQAFGILIPHGKQHDVAVLIGVHFRRPVIAGSPFYLAQGLLLIAPCPQVT